MKPEVDFFKFENDQKHEYLSKLFVNIKTLAGYIDSNIVSKEIELKKDSIIQNKLLIDNCSKRIKIDTENLERLRSRYNFCLKSIPEI